MAFIVKKVSSYGWPVTVETPDNGRFEKNTFDATFKHMGRSEFTKLADKGDKELLETVILGWDGLLTEDEAPMVYSVATLRELIDDPFFSRGCIKAYLESIEGAPAKN